MDELADSRGMGGGGANSNDRKKCGLLYLFHGFLCQICFSMYLRIMLCQCGAWDLFLGFINSFHS
jgi:hypothetical protein